MIDKQIEASRGAAPARRTRQAWGAALAFALIAIAGCAAPNKEAAKAGVGGIEHVCSSCHGMDGKSNLSSTFPRLAGQQQEYLVNQLKAFRDHTRADPHAHTYMWGMAAKLTDQQINGLAAFYSAQPPVNGTPGDPALMAAGAQIFKDGIPAENVPACILCHGEQAQGAGAIPRLAGQHRSYLERQLQAFAENSRANEIMHQNSVNLTPAQISDVTAYLAAQ